MDVTYSCPKCERTARVELQDSTEELRCPHCGHAIGVPADAVGENAIHRCVACPSVELFVRKDFPQAIGLTIVVIGFALSCITWYYYYPIATFAILFGTAAIDLLLYTLVGDSLVCYRCGAEYRGAAAMDVHGPFDLEVHERYRQQAARLAEVTRSSEGQP